MPREPLKQNHITARAMVLAFMGLLACGSPDVAPDADLGQDPSGEPVVPDGDDDLVPLDDGHDPVEIDTPDGSSSAGCNGGFQLGEESLVFRSDCLEVVASFLPCVSLDGAWHGGGRDGVCRVEQAEVVCPVGADGQVSAFLQQEQVLVRFEAQTAVALEALGLEGEVLLPGANSWLSNGFQSWSPSGVIALGAAPSQPDLDRALRARGDAELLRTGEELSWWFTFVAGPTYSLVAGVTSAEQFRSWIQTSRGEAEQIRIRLVNGGAGERISVQALQPVVGEPWYMQIGDDLPAMLGSYALALPSRHHLAGDGPDAGWNSWYQLRDDVDEAAVRQNAEIARSTLLDLYGDQAPELCIVVDDGWQQAWGIWEANPRFPSGLENLAADLEQAGLKMGVWLAPLLVSASSALAEEHPDWFVGGADYLHSSNGRMRILDVTNPDAAAHLQATVERIVSWGIDLLKIDFLFVGTYEGERYQQVTGMEAYHRALELIREAAGDQIVLVAVGAPPVPSFPYVDAWRLGGDIAPELTGPSWAFVVAQGRNLSARWFLCQATRCDADPLLQRDLPRNEVDVASWIVTFAGGGLFLSDDLRTLPQERTSWGLDPGRALLAVGGQPARPLDQVPPSPPPRLAQTIVDHLTGTTSQVVPVEWQLPGGGRVLVNCTDDAIPVDSISVEPHSAVDRGGLTHD